MQKVKYNGGPPIKLDGRRVESGDVVEVSDVSAKELLAYPDAIWTAIEKKKATRERSS